MPWSANARRRAVGIAVVLFWAVMAGWLVQRQLAGDRVATVQAVVGAPREGELWIGILDPRGRRLGFARVITANETRGGQPGAAVRVVAQLLVKAAATAGPLQMSATFWRARNGPRADLDAVLRAAGRVIRIRGTASGGEARVTVETPDGTVPLKLPIDARLLDPAALRWSFPELALAPGESQRVRALDPFSLTPSLLEITCLRREKLSLAGVSVPTRVIAIHTGRATITAWIADDGEVLQAETPFGLTLRRTTREEAAGPLEPIEAPELVDRALTLLEALPHGEPR
jgi:hypothetical protein